MKIKYIITISEDEDPVCVRKELEPGTASVLIQARTFQEAAQMFQEVKAA